MNSHIAAVIAAERHCDLKELATRRRAALGLRRRQDSPRRVGVYRRLRRSTTRTR